MANGAVLVVQPRFLQGYFLGQVNVDQYSLSEDLHSAGVRSAGRDAAVQLSLVQEKISPNSEPDFGSGSQIFMNLNLNLREPDFRSSSGSS